MLTEAAALDRLPSSLPPGEDRYPAIVKLWDNAWAEFVRLLSFDPEIRTIIARPMRSNAWAPGSPSPRPVGASLMSGPRSKPCIWSALD